MRWRLAPKRRRNAVRELRESTPVLEYPHGRGYT